ncbi:MAG: amidohydrolase family protein, partial [Acidimicrobiales bacterium]
MDHYLVISSDTHAGPPSEAYRDYLDPEYREAFDRDLETKLALHSVILEAASEEQEKFREDWEEETGDGGKLASYDPTTRDAELDKEGIAGEVIFPDADVLGGGASAPFSAGLQSSGELDGALVMAGARAHNRWLAELCSSSPERRCGVATVPILHDIDGAIAEMQRVADAGLRSMLIPT